MYGLARVPKTISTNMNKLFSMGIISLALGLTSCYYDNFKELKPEGALPSVTNTCDTSGVVSYSAQIVPILNASCTQNCHNGTGSGHDLTNYAAVNFDAAGGSLYGSVAQVAPYQAMPQGGSKLSDCDIAKIKKWVDGGAPNN